MIGPELGFESPQKIAILCMSICMNDSVRLQILNQCMSKHMDCMADFGFHAC